MTNKLFKFAALSVLTTLLLFSCTKENISTTESDFTQEISKRGSNSGPSIQITDASYSPEGESKKLFCCDVEWSNFQNGPGASASLFWNFTRYNVPSANAYRHNFTIFRNDVLFFSGTFPSFADPECPDQLIQLHWPNGLGNCCGVFSATLSEEYRVGTTWYTCDADQGEFNYFPFGCGWCE